MIDREELGTKYIRRQAQFSVYLNLIPKPFLDYDVMRGGAPTVFTPE